MLQCPVPFLCISFGRREGSGAWKCCITCSAQGSSLGKRHTVVVLMAAVSWHPEQLRAGPQRTPRVTPWPRVGFPTRHVGGRDLRAATGKNFCAGHATEREPAEEGGCLPALPSLAIRSLVLQLAAGLQCPPSAEWAQSCLSPGLEGS